MRHRLYNLVKKCYSFIGGRNAEDQGSQASEKGNKEIMNINRKDFFKKSLFSLGKAVCSASGVLKSPAETAITVPGMAGLVSMSDEELSAVAHNETCLARSSGCFACMERCETKAIKLIPGVGIRINQQLCSGCGTCEYVCPANPKAVRMQARTTTIQAPLADQAGLHRKDEARKQA